MWRVWPDLKPILHRAASVTMTTDANTPADAAATVAALRAQLADTHDELTAALNVANRMRQRALRAESALDSAAGAHLTTAAEVSRTSPTPQPSTSPTPAQLPGSPTATDHAYSYPPAAPQ